MMNSSDVVLWGAHHLWDKQQAERDGHGQMSVSKKQHEHPVGVQPRQQGEPAEEQHNGKSRDDPSGDDSRPGPSQRSTLTSQAAQPHIHPPPSLSPSSAHPVS